MGTFRPWVVVLTSVGLGVIWLLVIFVVAHTIARRYCLRPLHSPEVASSDYISRMNMPPAEIRQYRWSPIQEIELAPKVLVPRRSGAEEFVERPPRCYRQQHYAPVTSEGGWI
jgi:hypothetical protein